MSIKILGGVARGFDLATPKSQNTRPTSVLLKRRLFDSIQDFSDFTFVDLCAGTGSMGLEASSRGANKVVFVEEDPKAFNILKKNVSSFRKKFSEIGELQIEKLDFKKWIDRNLEEIKSLEGSELVIFFDPPYELVKLYDKFFEFVTEQKISARYVIEACTQKTMKLDQFSEKYGEPDKLFKQGTSYFAIYDFRAK